MARKAPKLPRATPRTDTADYRADHPFVDLGRLTSAERRTMLLQIAGWSAFTGIFYLAIFGGGGDTSDTETPPSTIVHTVIKGETPYSIVEDEIRTGREDPTVEISPDEVHSMLADVALLNGRAESNFTAVYPDQQIITINVPDVESNAASVQSCASSVGN